MLRRIVVVLSLLALTLAAASPALAEEKPPNTPLQPGRAIQGTITGINGSTWTVATENFGTLTVNMGSAGVKGSGKGKKGVAAIADFKAGNPGDRVVIKLQKQNRGQGNAPQSTTPTAQWVHLVPGKSFQHFNGEVTEVGSNSLKVKNGKGEERSFNVGTNATVQVGKQAKTFSSAGLAVGNKVTVVVRVADNSVTAIKLHGNDNGDDD